MISPHPNRNYPDKAGTLFLKGPIPLSWLRAALEAGSAASAVGQYLWYLRGLRKTTENLVVTRKGAKEIMGISKDILYRGLSRLSEANLITTTRGQGKAIRVTILTVNPKKSQLTVPPK